MDELRGITMQDFSTVWTQHYEQALERILRQHGTDRDVRSLEKLKQHLMTSRVFCEGQIADEERRKQEEAPLDTSALHEMRVALRADEVAFNQMCMRVTKVADQDADKELRRLAAGVVAILHIAIASVSHTIAAVNDLPLPNVA